MGEKDPHAISTNGVFDGSEDKIFSQRLLMLWLLPVTCSPLNGASLEIGIL